MTHGEQGEALLRAILDQPADDAVRLVYADWLEEGGQGERAEFVRVQVELAHALEGAPLDAATRAGWLAGWQGEARTMAAAHGGRSPCRCPPCLSRRECSLFAAHYRRWWGDLPGECRADVTAGVSIKTACGLSCLVRRGFLAEVRCPLDAWRRHGPAVVRAHPVVRAELTDRAPSPRPPTEVGWYRSSGRHEPEAGDTPAMLPASLFSRLTGGVLYDRSERGLFRARRIYGSEEGARDGLSDALLAWAKSPAALAQVT